ncbi:hypothetical protein B0I35DRAFT_485176 [Stachybotrys elegans]|uniref:Zn(2)-C6 fungal-type domain-containing protein n=1 Tax=Stachybotrys elegans TaxID=80388 RepID=A0A8K0SGL0_9HYPO|nr:hypothetical protein B0I35DRAFT_485176 [Stachybotrys elegans]
MDTDDSSSQRAQRKRPTPGPRPSRSLEICFQCRNRKVRQPVSFRCPGSPRGGPSAHGRLPNPRCVQRQLTKAEYQVKCDGTPGGCENCRRLRFECSFSDKAGGEHAGLTEIERRRVRRACVTCRDRKSKCSGTLPSCMRCSRLRLQCRYPNQQNPGSEASPTASEGKPESGPANQDKGAANLSASGRGPSRSPAALSSSPRGSANSLGYRLPSVDQGLSLAKAVSRQHIDAYFEFIYPIPFYGFLHRASLLQRWSQGTLNPCLLLGMAGVTSRYLNLRNESRGEHGPEPDWIQEAETRLLSRLAEPRTSDVEAWMLITMNHFLSGKFQKMLVAMSLVTRLALILRLNIEEPRLPFLAQERRRRLMWSIYVTDTLYSSGRTEFTACPAEIIHLQLPCREESFLMDVPAASEPLKVQYDNPSPVNLGLAAYSLRVLDIRDRAQRLSLALTNHRRPLGQCLEEVEGLRLELQHFLDSLPAEYHWNDKNFFLHAYTPSRITLLMLHAWWHQSHCDLYRFAIPGFREGLPDSDIAQLSQEYALTCRSRCLSHAIAVSRLLDTVLQPGVELISDPSLAMCAFHSARVISRLGQPPTGNMARAELIERLLACANAIQEQAKIYPRSALLHGGIMELVHNAQRSGGAPAWTEEEATARAEQENNPNSKASLRDHEVDSRYSVSEEIRKLRFEDEDEDAESPAESRDDVPDTAQQAGPVYHNPQGEAMMDPNSRLAASQMANMASASSGNMEQLHATVFDSPECHIEAPVPLGSSQNYDMMAFSFDPRYQAGQPDIFMDSFWPIPGNADWMLPNQD